MSPENPANGRPLDVVIVNSELPYPPTAGNRIRTLHLVERLAKRHRIIFIARRNPDDREAAEATEYLRTRGIDVLLVDRAVPRKSGPIFYARLAANLLSRLPYSVASHSSDAVRAAVREHAARHPVDVWQAESVGFLEVLRDLENVPKVVIAHNVETLIWERYGETESNPLKKWYIGQQRRKFERFERRAFRDATRVVAVSPADARLMRERFGQAEVDVVDNGIDRNDFGSVRRDPDPRRILYLGSFDWRPNLDAVGLLLERIFPAVLAEEPTARLELVGRQPPEALVKRVASLASVELHADVPDVRPYLARAGVMTVPLRIGGGSRLKILEALASGLPVVSTRIGAEGLELSPGQHYVEADTPEEMARALVRCIRDPAPAAEMTERVRRFVLDRYDWDALANRLEAVWVSCVGPSAHRRR
jgi:polysaccharide biosynthesis protein PslH